jgi:hypothetical protein
MYMGDTCTGQDNFKLSCGGTGSNEIVYRVVSWGVGIDVWTNGFIMDVATFGKCGPGIACGPGVSAAGGQIVKYIVVESNVDGQCGQYSITINPY